MSNRFKKKSPLRNLKVMLGRAAAEILPGTVNVMKVLHDNRCPGLLGQSMLLCTCSPEMNLKEVHE